MAKLRSKVYKTKKGKPPKRFTARNNDGVYGTERHQFSEIADMRGTEDVLAVTLPIPASVIARIEHFSQIEKQTPEALVLSLIIENLPLRLSAPS